MSQAKVTERFMTRDVECIQCENSGTVEHVHWQWLDHQTGKVGVRCHRKCNYCGHLIRTYGRCKRRPTATARIDPQGMLGRWGS